MPILIRKVQTSVPPIYLLTHFICSASKSVC